MLTDVQQRTAEQLFRTLGELKGGAMKFGQAMSIFEAALPDELAAPYREQLTKLQDSAPPMPTMTVREILARELGADWKDHLVELDPVPAAAASIGQVHRGRWVDGREVAVKVQYPGAAEALTCDLRQIARVARGLGPLVPGLDIKRPGRGAAGPRRRGARLPARGGGPAGLCRRVPRRPRHRRPGRRRSQPGTVLVTEWMESPGSLARVIREGTQEERDHYGLRASCGSCSTPRARTGMLHADPHPGNFRLLPAEDGSPGRLGVLDFGAVARLPERQLPDIIGALIRIATAWRTTTSWSPRCATRASSARRSRSTPTQLRAYLGPFIEPASVEEFHFSRAWMQEQFRRVNDPRGDAYAAMLRLNLPPAYMLIHRTFAGRRRRAQPARGAGAVPPGAPRLAARVRRLTDRVRVRRAAGYHHSESSLLSIARRWRREHSSQNQRCLPFSTAEVQVIGGSSDSTVVPQKEQVTTAPR